MHTMSAFLMLARGKKLAMQTDTATVLLSATNQSHDILSC